jgi:hypothetical protein
MHYAGRLKLTGSEIKPEEDRFRLQHGPCGCCWSLTVLGGGNGAGNLGRTRPHGATGAGRGREPGVAPSVPRPSPTSAQELLWRWSMGRCNPEN